MYLKAELGAASDLDLFVSYEYRRRVGGLDYGW